MIECGGQNSLKMLHVLIVDVWHKGIVPDDWRIVLLVSLYSNGDPTNIDDYRGISLLSLPEKVFAILLKKRLQTWAEAMLTEEQCGVRTGKLCNDASFSLKGLCELISNAGHAIHTRFINLSKAYGAVDRLVAWELFQSLGYPHKMLQLITDLHKNTVCVMQEVQSKPASWFQVCTGSD